VGKSLTVCAWAFALIWITVKELWPTVWKNLTRGGP